jgi:tetratricopeptide (TPR) repeat protein
MLLQYLGMAQLANNDLSTAIGTFRRLLAQNSQSPDAQYWLGQALGKAGESEPAIAAWKEALNLAPGFPPAAFAISQFFIKQERFDDALAFAKELQNSQPNSALGLRLEGDSAFARNNYAVAALAYGKALETAPNPELAHLVFRSLMLAGEQEKAIAGIKAWLEKQKNDGVSWSLLGKAYQKSGRVKEAVSIYENAHRLLPNDLESLNNLTWAYQESGHGDKALALAEKLSTMGEKNAEALDTAGWVLVRNGKPEKGLAVLQKAIDLEPAKHPHIQLHHTEALIALGRRAEAKTDLQQYLRTTENFSDAEKGAALKKQAETLLKSL